MALVKVILSPVLGGNLSVYRQIHKDLSRCGKAGISRSRLHVFYRGPIAQGGNLPDHFTAAVIAVLFFFPDHALVPGLDLIFGPCLVHRLPDYLHDKDFK
jgi:hypothetical protein